MASEYRYSKAYWETPGRVASIWPDSVDTTMCELYGSPPAAGNDSGAQSGGEKPPNASRLILDVLLRTQGAAATLFELRVRSGEKQEALDAAVTRLKEKGVLTLSGSLKDEMTVASLTPLYRSRLNV